MARAKQPLAKQTPSTRVLRPRTSKAKQPSPKLTTLRPKTVRFTKKELPSPTAAAPSSTSSNTLAPPAIVCDCAIKRAEIHQGCIECQQCRNAQDPDCVLPPEGLNELGGEMTRCNNCRMSDLRQQIVAHQRNLETLTRIVRQRRAELHRFCAKRLWMHYCQLPNGQSSKAVITITETLQTSQGTTRPINGAPEGWVEEVKARLTKMTKDADTRILSAILGANEQVKCAYLKDLAQWREIAVWMLHRGAYRGLTAKAALGILAEVLGLEEKGTVWDGGWMDGFLSPVSELHD